MSAPKMPESLAASLEGSKAEYVRLGKSGLKVSVPIFGTMSIGDPGWIDWVEGEEKVTQIPHHITHALPLKLTIHLSPSPSSKPPTIKASTPGIPRTSTPTAQARSLLERRSRNIIFQGIRLWCWRSVLVLWEKRWMSGVLCGGRRLRLVKIMLITTVSALLSFL